jgi:hypothetical protein
VLSRIALCLLGGLALNALLLYSQAPEVLAYWRSGQWGSMALSALMVPIMIVSMVAYVVLGYRLGLMAAIEHAWQTLGNPLLDAVAERAAGLAMNTGEPLTSRMKQLAGAVNELAARVPRQRWLVRKVVGMMLARLPFSELLADPELTRKVQSLTDEKAIAGLLRKELDRMELPNIGWVPLAAVVVVNTVAVLLLG